MTHRGNVTIHRRLPWDRAEPGWRRLWPCRVLSLCLLGPLCRFVLVRSGGAVVYHVFVGEVTWDPCRRQLMLGAVKLRIKGFVMYRQALVLEQFVCALFSFYWECLCLTVRLSSWILFMSVDLKWTLCVDSCCPLLMSLIVCSRLLPYFTILNQ